MTRLLEDVRCQGLVCSLRLALHGAGECASQSGEETVWNVDADFLEHFARTIALAGHSERLSVGNARNRIAWLELMRPTEPWKGALRISIQHIEEARNDVMQRCKRVDVQQTNRQSVAG